MPAKLYQRPTAGLSACSRHHRTRPMTVPTITNITANYSQV